MRTNFLLFVFLLLQQITLSSTISQNKSKPLMRDFMGLCVHTVQFRTELYKPVCRLVRDYHGLNWDVGDETDFWPVFPFARNRVNWQQMYSDWNENGFEIDACIMFSGIPQPKWDNPVRDANTYGFAFARFFGPGNHNLVKSMEIGNEPGDYDDAFYRTIFENMARGIRSGDPLMKIVTCATTAGQSHKYTKSLSCLEGFNELYDVINVHSYAEVEGWPTWKRSFPEDPQIDYLKDIQAVIDWKKTNAPDKEVWLTEFGWDACTQEPEKEGTFKQWKGSTETEQARYLVRSFLIFSSMDIDRAYIFFFNDEDKPQVHGSSGLTRNYQPKPAYYAVSHLYKTLGNYRFNRILTKSADMYLFEYVKDNESNEKILAAWSPTGTNNSRQHTITIGEFKIVKIEKMPLSNNCAQNETWQALVDDKIQLLCDESPVYIHLTNKMN